MPEVLAELAQQVEDMTMTMAGGGGYAFDHAEYKDVRARSDSILGACERIAERVEASRS